MLKLLSIIKKDLKLLIRSKGSASIIILGPLIVILLVSLGFSTSNTYNINIAAYSPSYSDLSNSIIEKLQQEKFTVNKFENEENCITSVKNGLNHICMTIPPNLKIDASEQQSINFYVDYSRINLVYAITSSISSNIQVTSSELSQGLAQSLIDVIDKTNSELASKKSTISSLSSTNALINIKLGTLNQDIQLLNTSIAASNLEDNVDNATSMVESSNLTNNQKDYVLDVIGTLENELSNKIGNIQSTKTKVNEKVSSLQQTVSGTSGDITSLDKSVSLISSDISAIGIKNAGVIASPITTKIEPITTEKSNLNFTFPILLVLILSFVSIILSSNLVISEKTSNAFFRNSITPTKDILFILANYLTPLIIIILQFITIFGIASIFMKSAFIPQLPLIISIVLLAATLFILLGMFLGHLFKSSETATIASISVISLMIFFSNIILPLESLPTLIRQIANLNPIVVSETLLRRVILFNSGFENIYKGLIILSLYIITLMILMFMQYHFIKDSYKIRRIVQK